MNSLPMRHRSKVQSYPTARNIAARLSLTLPQWNRNTRMTRISPINPTTSTLARVTMPDPMPWLIGLALALLIAFLYWAERRYPSPHRPRQRAKGLSFY